MVWSPSVIRFSRVVAPVPPFATGRVPVNELTGKLVQLLKFPDEGVPKAGPTNVLLDNVSVVSLPTNVSVDVGRVSVPVLIIVEIDGELTNSNLTFWLSSVLSKDNLILFPATNFKSSCPVGDIEDVVPIWPPSETA